MSSLYNACRFCGDELLFLRVDHFIHKQINHPIAHYQFIAYYILDAVWGKC